MRKQFRDKKRKQIKIWFDNEALDYLNEFTQWLKDKGHKCGLSDVVNISILKQKEFINNGAKDNDGVPLDNTEDDIYYTFNKE